MPRAGPVGDKIMQVVGRQLRDHGIKIGFIIIFDGADLDDAVHDLDIDALIELQVGPSHDVDGGCARMGCCPTSSRSFP
ncbi:MAG: hypothetical protein WDN06_08280 [Asticcacaulis sp.]